MQNNDKSFHYQSLKIHLHPEVYEPAEDTFLLLDSVRITSGQHILEIGSGTGIISLYAALVGAKVICSDINPYAIDIIKKNIQENNDKLKGTIEVRRGNIFKIIRNDETFDSIIFNPPYLPTTTKEKKGISKWYAHSFDGGLTGLDVSRRFLKSCSTYLTKDGTAYIIISSLSKQQNIDELLSNIALKYKVINQLRCDDEVLFVYQFFKNNK